MPVYELSIRGENFRWKEHETIRLMGFYTTRLLEASDEIEAEALAMAALRDTPELQKPEWHDGTGPNAKVYVEEIAEIVSGWDGNTAIGFVWFPEES